MILRNFQKPTKFEIHKNPHNSTKSEAKKNPQNLKPKEMPNPKIVVKILSIADPSFDFYFT